VIVVACVTQDEDGGLRGDLAAEAVPEGLQRVAVVGVAVDPDDVGLGVDLVDGLVDVDGTASLMSMARSKYSVTSSSPSMNTNERTFENCAAIV
jgi:hypothetical protein